jgi:hypothetical protein
LKGFIVSMQTEPGYEKTASRPPEGMGVFHPLGEQADASIDNLLQRLRAFLLILMRNQGFIPPLDISHAFPYNIVTIQVEVANMHFTISWEIEAEGELQKRIHGIMMETLKRQATSVAEPLPKYFVVGVESETKWQLILKMLKGICLMHKGKIRFVMSPVMTGGQYNGEIRDWTKVNETAK